MPNSQVDPATVTNTLRPGYLVGLKTSVTGNVKYNKTIIENEHKLRSGALKASWKTERLIEDPEEHNKANKARMKARQIISAVCSKSAFGLLCPESKAEQLTAAIAEARRVVALFNRRSQLTNVAVYVITGKVARDDVEAVRAIKSEVRDLLKNMSEGVKDLDVKKVREAANKARSIGSMLSPEAAEKIQGAISAARTAAKKIVKAGEQAAGEIDREALRAIQQARTSFLEIDGDEVNVQASTPEGRAVDLHEGIEPDDETANDNTEQQPEVAAAPAQRTPRRPRPARKQAAPKRPYRNRRATEANA